MKLKKITAIVPAEASYEIGELMNAAVSFTIEAVEDDKRTRVKRAGRMPGRRAVDIIMNHYTAQTEFHITDAGVWLKNEAGMNPVTASPALSRLSKHGYLKRLGGRRFRFIKPMEPGANVL